MGKKDQSVNKSSRFGIKQAVLALILLLLVIFAGRLVQLAAQISQPFNLPNSEKRQYSLDPNTTINLVFTSLKDPVSPVIYLLSFNPKEQKIVVLHISNDIYTSLPKDLGQWRIGSVYQLGQENETPQGVALLKVSLSKLVGLPVDGILIQNDLSSKSLSDIILNLRKNPLAQIKFISSLKTDLSLVETVKFLAALSSVRSNNVTELDLATSTITESKLLPDSTRVLGVNMVKLDTFIRENMPDSNISDEGKTIAIFNATNHPGLAAEAARFVTNLGGNVVITQSLQDQQVQKSAVIVQNGVAGEVTALRLSQLFAPSCIKISCTSSDPKITSSRAQVNIILGEDFFQYWHKP